jgi:hypothetical protein
LQINELKDENDRMRSRMRELEGQTVQLIGEKKSLENNLEEARLQLQQLQLQQMSAVPQAVPEVEIDQVKLYFLRNLI